MTNVPAPSFTNTGFVPPTEQDILAGVEEDLNAAFQTTLNFGTLTNPTPQGQIAQTFTAALGQAYSVFCLLANSTDPAYNSGRWQDAIGRIYFMERDPGAPTQVLCTCIGGPNVLISAGALAQDTAGNTYYAVSGGQFSPSGGSITVLFQNQIVGPIPCPEDTLTVISTTVPGWDAITNPADGILGSNVENRAQFEMRRQASVQSNAIGMAAAALGAVFAVSGVIDAYVQDNSNSYPLALTPVCQINGSISGTTLTVSSVISGTVAIGQTVTGSDQSGIGVAAGTVITGGSGTSWTLNNSQTVGATVLNLGGTVVPPNGLYAAAIGGNDTAVATALWTKKAPGAPWYSGANTSITVYDANVQYPSPGVAYVVKFERPPALGFAIVVKIANGPGVPSNATALVQTAIVNAFAGSDGGQRVRIGFPLYASRLYAGIAALGPWAAIEGVLLGTANNQAAAFTASVGASYTATVAGTLMTVSAVADGTLAAGDIVSGTGITPGTTISSLGSGSGGTGTYNLNQSSTVGAPTSTISQNNILSVSAVALGALGVNQVVGDSGNVISNGSWISSLGTGSGNTGTYFLLSAPQRVTPESMYSIAPSLSVVQVGVDQAPTVDPTNIIVILV